MIKDVGMQQEGTAREAGPDSEVIEKRVNRFVVHVTPPLESPASIPGARAW